MQPLQLEVGNLLENISRLISICAVVLAKGIVSDSIIQEAFLGERTINMMSLFISAA